jgi:DNA-binding transcriptional regulator YhcF (GntR family)
VELYQKINPDSEIPKFRQVADMVISDIESGIFKQGQQIPSINETSEELLISRDTVEKAYNYLKDKGILSSVRGKGYFVSQVNVRKQLRVALILNKLSNYKRSIYYSMANTLGNKATVDVYIYNYDPDEFSRIIDNQLTRYDYYVILPNFRSEFAGIAGVLRKLPHEKVMLIDRNLESLRDYPIVYQEYEKDIIEALSCGIEQIRKYSRFTLVFPTDQYYSKNIVRGFRIFCQMNQINHEVIDQLNPENVTKGEAFVVVSDDDLYNLIRIVRQKGLRLGIDTGVVAYNENPVKELLENGITTLSTDHEEIGRLAAQMILTRDFRRIKSPFEFILRNSL